MAYGCCGQWCVRSGRLAVSDPRDRPADQPDVLRADPLHAYRHAALRLLGFSVRKDSPPALTHPCRAQRAVP